MEYLTICLVLWTSVYMTTVYSLDFPVNNKCPGKCDLSKCNKLSYCDGTIVKDECECCPKCSSDTWSHPKVSSVNQGRCYEGICLMCVVLRGGRGVTFFSFICLTT